VSVGSPDNEERRLLAEYETTTHFYSSAVRDLSRRRGALSQDEYDTAFNLAEDTRMNCEKARNALQDFRDGKRKSK
jgi:hypothetical protein